MREYHFIKKKIYIIKRESEIKRDRVRRRKERKEKERIHLHFFMRNGNCYEIYEKKRKNDNMDVFFLKNKTTWMLLS